MGSGLRFVRFLNFLIGEDKLRIAQIAGLTPVSSVLYAYVGNDVTAYKDPYGLERLNYTMLPGRPSPPIIPNPVRLPEFLFGPVKHRGAAWLVGASDTR